MRHKFDFFFRKNKHRSFPQADAVVFGGHSQVCPITQDKFRLSLKYLNKKKKKRDEVDFLQADKCKKFPASCFREF